MTIPKIIHYCWFGGGTMNGLIQRCMASWRSIMPDYEIQRWDETNAPLDHPPLAHALAWKRYGLASDYLRGWALARHGGIYFDVDVEVVRRFDPLLELEAFIGFQEEQAGGHWVNGAVMGAVAGHWFPVAWLRYCHRAHFRRVKPPIGPEICTALLQEAGLRSYGLQTIRGVTVFPRPWFYPYHVTEHFDPACITPDTYAIHHWNNDWGPGARRSRLNKWWYRLCRMATVIPARLMPLPPWPS